MVEWTGFPQLEARLKSIGEATPINIATAMYEEAQTIIADAVNNYVPFDQGALSNSGRVDLPTVTAQEVSVVFGFGGIAAPYAVAVHENPRSGKTGGVSPQGKPYPHFARRGEWKYLETPLKKRAPEVADALRNAINESYDATRAQKLAFATGF